ncbi:hypothetical protein MUY27_19115 [Mucilaginibacter sp. RS28]|uniref:Uncharacterized protein n=1 Tax=Mucilaginibacter straminoryzae TaxID=2932774 RepID=A0A9X1X6J9_9SPHI|nr:hypothetical protein [Mucilaginibacter straminoryzae]MCJ8211838.1 hypothetical protein [Mucilaginibacter straminoryzae]
MIVTKPEYCQLIEVFRLGLKLTVIDVSEVKVIAEKILMAEEEPEYVLIELCIAKDANAMLSILSESACINSVSPIPMRVILGLIFKKFSEEKLSADEAADKIRSINQHESQLDLLTGAELIILDEIDFDFEFNDNELLGNDLLFLRYYDEFNLENYSNWTSINCSVEIKLSDVEQELIEDINKKSNSGKTVIAINERVVKIGLLIVVPLAFLLVTVIFFEQKKGVLLSKFITDVYDIAKWIVFITIVYVVLLPFYYLLKKLFALFN